MLFRTITYLLLKSQRIPSKESMSELRSIQSKQTELNESSDSRAKTYLIDTQKTRLLYPRYPTVKLADDSIRTISQSTNFQNTTRLKGKVNSSTILQSRLSKSSKKSSNPLKCQTQRRLQSEEEK